MVASMRSNCLFSIQPVWIAISRTFFIVKSQSSNLGFKIQRLILRPRLFRDSALLLPMNAGNRTAIHSGLDLRFRIALGVENLRKPVGSHAKDLWRFHHTSLAPRAFVLVDVRNSVQLLCLRHEWTLYLSVCLKTEP